MDEVFSIIESGVRVLLYLLAAALGFYLMWYTVFDYDLNSILIILAGTILTIKGLEGALKV